MKRRLSSRLVIFSLVLAASFLSPPVRGALKPYILAGAQTAPLDTVEKQITAALKSQGFEIAGAYAPGGTDTSRVICVTHPLLKKAVAEAGGLTAFAAVLRVGLRAKGDTVNVSFMNPAYWGNAYFRDQFPSVEALYAKLDKKLRHALDGLSDQRFEPYGSEKGLSVKKLRRYHYMMAMPYFDDVVVLRKHSSYAEIIKQINRRAADSKSPARKVYEVDFPEQQTALFGLALTGPKGENHFVPKIDFGEPRHTAFLPYEILVRPDRVVMLHGKYRIALSFPDLTMGTFMKIMSTPGDIADEMKTLVAP